MRTRSTGDHYQWSDCESQGKRVPLIDRQYFERAVSNAALWGDTDIFPFPFDNHIMHDKPEQVVDILVAMASSFDTTIDLQPIQKHSTLAPVGYTGFRWATQIDPLWNVYLLGVVLSIASEIEAARIPQEQEIVFSYRYDATTEGIFAPGGWHDFQARCRVLAGKHPYVVTADIADFYPRIYHHRVENALKSVDAGGAATRQIREILIRLSDSASYGLPVGGPAARLLSEITINQIDRLLDAEGGNSEFCRYADDFRIFVDDLPAAYQMIGMLSDKLHSNQGLSLQKSKTAILTSEEYLAILDPQEPPEGSAAKFLSLHLHFDPYSESPSEDYERLRDNLSQFDILDLLRTELLKGQIHASLTRKLVRALRFLDDEDRQFAIVSLLDEGNFERLAPVMPQVLMAVRDSLQGLDEEFIESIARTICGKIEAEHYLSKIELNLSYMIRILALRKSPETTKLLIRLFSQPHGYRGAPSPLVQRDIMLILARWGTSFWLGDQRSHYQNLHPWVKRAFSVSSFTLSDEGRHWRRAHKPGMSEYDRLIIDWASERSQNTTWVIPL